ncbi:MAG: hypothetical protein KGL52_00580 [Rhodospirillales bacterium]|nr:hypothetical protein [Rhodospirillales bacterium]
MIETLARAELADATPPQPRPAPVISIRINGILTVEIAVQLPSKDPLPCAT